MDNRIDVLREEIKQKLSSVGDLAELDKLRVGYLGKKGSITALLKGMKDLTNEERKTFGAEVNKLKANAAELIDKKVEELNRKAIEAEINLMPVFDVTTPPELTRGSYHPVTLSQRQCEAVFKSMGFTVEDYAEVVTLTISRTVSFSKRRPRRHRTRFSESTARTSPRTACRSRRFSRDAASATRRPTPATRIPSSRWRV